jgi:hypothetical protein
VVEAKANISIGGRSSECVFVPFSTMQQTLTWIFCFSHHEHQKGVQRKTGVDECTGLIKTQNEICAMDPQAIGVVNWRRSSPRLKIYLRH